MESNWLTTIEASELTQYNAEHIRQLVRTGKVNAKKWGSSWMIDRDSLMDYMIKEGRGPKKKTSKKDLTG